MGSRTGSVRPSVASIHLPPMRACDLNRAMSLRCAIIPICKRTQRITIKSLPILILHISLFCLTHTICQRRLYFNGVFKPTKRRKRRYQPSSINTYLYSGLQLMWLLMTEIKARQRQETPREMR